MPEDPPFAPNAYKVTTFFPILNNDGDPFDEDTWSWWRDEMTRFQGYTDMGLVLGYWEKHTEENRWVFWIVASVEQVTEIQEFVITAKRKFGQLEMFFECERIFFKGL